MSNNDWYRYYAPRRVPRSPDQIAVECAAAEQDLDFVLAQITLDRSDRVLEIGCGWGRHALALARRGFDQVTSIDIAPESLAIARALAAEHNLRCDFRQQDFMDVHARSYAAILSLYDRSCCGFPTEAEDMRSLRHLAQLVQPNGWLVFGINDWPFALPGSSQRWHEIDDGVELIEVIPDRVAMTCTDRLTLICHDGRRKRYELTRRHYYVPELRRMLAEAGFTISLITHRLCDAYPYGDGSDGLFVFAQRDKSKL